jgi:hypothetical protein
MPARQSHIHHALPYVFAVILAVAARPADAATTRQITATQATLTSALASLKPGETLVLEGRFNETLIRNRDFGGVTIDARRAEFAGGLLLRNVQNVSFIGGTYGSRIAPMRGTNTVEVLNGFNISFAHATIVGDNDGKGLGVMVRQSRNVTVRDTQLDGHRTGLASLSSSDSLFTRNQFLNMSSDGINLSDSHRILASHNLCKGFAPTPGAHPDCIQLWSLRDKPLQSDIYLLNNTAYGATQGFASFDPDTASGIRFTFAGNYMETSYPQGVACYGCFDSRFLNNTLIATPGARWRTSMNIVGGARNEIAGNLLYDWRGGAPAWASSLQRQFSDLVPSIAGVGSTLDYRGYGLEPMGRSVGTVPEPATWAQMIIGLMLIGIVRRGRQNMILQAS